MSFAPCGIDCETCPFKDDCGGGCFECGGKPFYIKDFGVELCPIYDCAVNKMGYKSCIDCPDLPCQLFYDWRDPSMTEEEHNQSINERVAAMKAFKAAQ